MPVSEKVSCKFSFLVTSNYWNIWKYFALKTLISYKESLQDLGKVIENEMSVKFIRD